MCLSLSLPASGERQSHERQTPRTTSQQQLLSSLPHSCSRDKRQDMRQQQQACRTATSQHQSRPATAAAAIVLACMRTCLGASGSDSGCRQREGEKDAEQSMRRVDSKEGSLAVKQTCSLSPCLDPRCSICICIPSPMHCLCSDRASSPKLALARPSSVATTERSSAKRSPFRSPWPHFASRRRSVACTAIDCSNANASSLFLRITQPESRQQQQESE